MKISHHFEIHYFNKIELNKNLLKLILYFVQISIYRLSYSNEINILISINISTFTKVLLSTNMNTITCLDYHKLVKSIFTVRLKNTNNFMSLHSIKTMDFKTHICIYREIIFQKKCLKKGSYNSTP